MLKVAEPCAVVVLTHECIIMTWLKQRSSGVLLHITSLSGPFRCGVIGQEARHFIDMLASGGYRAWQFLPLGPTHDHGSPYESLSSFAGNPELIDLRPCIEQGWLTVDALDKIELNHPDAHQQLRQQAGHAFWQAVEKQPQLAKQIEIFQQQHHTWLNDYTLFSTIKRHSDNSAWWQWPDALRLRHSNALASIRKKHQHSIKQIIFEQWLFEQQWQQLKTYAESKSIKLFGDLPIYVAHDSADVWAQPSQFTLNKQGLCEEVAGVPPDYFSEKGQRWGNPLYRWQSMQADGFTWWTQRIQHQFQRMHLLRIDHFRGIEAYWAIPSERHDGIVGEWKKAPGEALLATLQDKLGNLPLVAEDLGIITEEVDALRQKFGLPGMKILQFAFNGDEKNPYLPCNHTHDSVVYTGTHDNDTTVGWYQSLTQDEQAHVKHILGEDIQMPWSLNKCALASPALLAILPMQDLLGLDSRARFNTPGTLDGNWLWRMPADITTDIWQQSLDLNKKNHRI